MAAQRDEFLASQAVTASSNSPAHELSTVTMLMVGVDVTAGSGTPTLDMWLQGSDDGGTTWYDLVADQVLKSAAAAASNSVSTNVRDIIDGKTTTTAEKFVAIYKHVPTDRVRLNWIMSGGSPSLTLSASWVGK